MLISNIYVDNDAQLFETPRKQLQCQCTRGIDFVGLWLCSVVWNSQNKQSQCHCTRCPDFIGWWLLAVLWNPPSKKTLSHCKNAHIFLWSDSMQCQHRNRTHRSGQKLPPPRKWYLCFQMNGETAHSVKFSNSCALTKVIDLIPGVE